MPCHPRFQNFKNLTFYLYLVRNNIMKVCGGVETYIHAFFNCLTSLTLILLTWIIWWAPNNVSRWQAGFNSVFKGLKIVVRLSTLRFHHRYENSRFSLNTRLSNSHCLSGPFEEWRGFVACRELNNVLRVAHLVACSLHQLSYPSKYVISVS